MTWSGLEIAVVLGLFGVSITIFVVGIVCPSATRPRLNTDRSNLKLAFRDLQDDAIVLMSLGADDLSEIESHVA